MRDPVEINVSQDDLTVDHVDQAYMTVDPWDKFHLLRMLLEREKPKLVIIFCNTKHGARKLAKRLYDAGMNAKEIHGDLVQQKRERVMERFRKHNIHLLVATDLAARGIDVNGITHIINYDTPPDPHVYVHRIGRTARMGSFGKAITFVTREQGKQLTEIELLINKQIHHEQYDDFVARPAPDREGPAAEATAPAKSRYSTSVFSEGLSEGETVATTSSRPKSLGARFKPARKRRR
jgi:ATP-dependent RNA helicase DeaD